MHRLGGDADGQTPLDPDEAAQILRPAITTRGELDIVEQESIAQAIRWAFGRRRNPQTVLEERFLRRLHKRMFGDVWRWAGTYRQTARNIGVEHWMIQEEIGRLLGDSRFWVEHSREASRRHSLTPPRRAARVLRAIRTSSRGLQPGFGDRGSSVMRDALDVMTR